mmetsp:Transcript_28392/g.64348  ORF Transcript_28392/g.64348 Transcript_28392/m.64348 type:complete len:212 (+) Transcript_28392:837-1472(+)
MAIGPIPCHLGRLQAIPGGRAMVFIQRDPMASGISSPRPSRDRQDEPCLCPRRCLGVADLYCSPLQPQDDRSDLQRDSQLLCSQLHPAAGRHRCCVPTTERCGRFQRADLLGAPQRVGWGCRTGRSPRLHDDQSSGQARPGSGPPRPRRHVGGVPPLHKGDGGGVRANLLLGYQRGGGGRVCRGRSLWLFVDCSAPGRPAQAPSRPIEGYC